MTNKLYFVIRWFVDVGVVNLISYNDYLDFSIALRGWGVASGINLLLFPLALHLEKTNRLETKIKLYDNCFGLCKNDTFSTY